MANFIQGAVKKPGALKRQAVANKIKGKLTSGKLDKLAALAKKRGDSTLMRRVNLAKTLRKLAMRRKAG